MFKHEFGGSWTSEKLECLKEYLNAYRRIFSTNPKAQYFITNYVDAFAGTGYRTDSKMKSSASLPLLNIEDLDDAEYAKGSARIALEVYPAFHKYLFIDKNPQHILELGKLKIEYPDLASRITIQQADANSFLLHWCAETDWNKNRAVVFLDPYGMQVDWNTIQAIAATKAIDLWLLFPLGMGVNRLLTRDRKPSEDWAKSLTRIFGTDEWNSFYKPRKEQTLFGEIELGECKNADFDEIGKFFMDRLQSVFEKVASEPLQLCNSKNNPIYLLCFAAGNNKGAPIAVRIAGDIIKRRQSRR